MHIHNDDFFLGGGGAVLHDNIRYNVTMRAKCAAGQLEKQSVEVVSFA